MNKMYTKYAEFVTNWMANPTPPTQPIFLRVHHQLWIYEIDVKFLALYVEMGNLDRKPFPAPKINFDHDDKHIAFDFIVSKRLDDKESRRQTKLYETYDRDETIFRMIKKNTSMLRIDISWGNKHLL